MCRFAWMVLSILVAVLIQEHEAAAPLFLQAITSALATIPFTGGPMTTGLVGAKLAIGTKLLYYLGFFGKKSAPKPVSPMSVAPNIPSGAGFAGGLQPLPLPYFLSGAGRFPQVGSDFGAQEQFYQEDPFDGTDPAQLFQALKDQGFDSNTAMQMINYGGFAQGGAQGFANVPKEFPQDLIGDNFHDTLIESKPSDAASQDIESFFTFLRDMDENSCISRLVCDIGDNPSFLGEFSENIHSIVRSLDVTSSSGASPYIEIMEIGRKEGGCSTRFPECTDTAYEIVKNVAPSVGVPENIPL